MCCVHTSCIRLTSPSCFLCNCPHFVTVVTIERSASPQLRMELSKRAAEVSALEARVALQSDYIQQLEACVGQARSLLCSVSLCRHTSCRAHAPACTAWTLQRTL